MSFLIGSFGWFFMWFLLFVKQLPVMAIAELKEIIAPRNKHAHAGHGVSEPHERYTTDPKEAH
jgi:molybdopterin-containing oxidoreductase family membrane subunit